MATIAGEQGSKWREGQIIYHIRLWFPIYLYFLSATGFVLADLLLQGPIRDLAYGANLAVIISVVLEHMKHYPEQWQ